MTLEILTPEKQIFKGEIESVTLPGKQGSFTLLPYHAPLIATLKGGDVKYVSNLNEYHVSIGGGIVEINDNKVIVCVDSI